MMFSLLIISALLYQAESTSRLGKWCSFGNAFTGTGAQGNRDYVESGESVDLPGDFTIEAWIWATNPTSKTWNTIVSRANLFWEFETDLPNPYTDFNFQVDDYGLLSFFMGNGLLQPFQYGILARSSEPIPAQKWTHVAIAVSAPGGTPRTAIMYINGEEVDRDAWSEGQRQVATQLFVSRYDNTDQDVQFWDGRIDELRIWNSVRTKAQILSSMFLSLNELGTAGTALYYKFDVNTRDEDQFKVTDFSRAGNNTGYVTHDGVVAPAYWAKSEICV